MRARARASLVSGDAATAGGAPPAAAPPRAGGEQRRGLLLGLQGAERRQIPCRGVGTVRERCGQTGDHFGGRRRAHPDTPPALPRLTALTSLAALPSLAVVSVRRADHCQLGADRAQL